MSEKVGAISRPPTGETYYARYAGFERDAAGKIRLYQGTRTKTDKNTNETYTIAYTRVYPQYHIVTGKYAGISFTRAVYVKGFKLVPGEDGEVRPMFDHPGEYKPYFINDMRANGVDFTVDMKRPLFDSPVTQMSVLEGVDALLLEKAKGGNLVAVKLAELGDGTLVISTALDGVSKISPEMAEMLRGKIQTTPTTTTPPPPSGPVTPVQAEQQRLAEYVRYLMGVAKEAETVDAKSLQVTITGQVKEWGIRLQPNVPTLSLLGTDQLLQVIDQVLVVLERADIAFLPLTPAEPEPAQEDEMPW